MSLSATGGGLPRVGRRGALVLLGGCLTGCIEAPLPPARLGINAWVGYDPLVLARDRRLFDGGVLQVVELATGAETQRHLRNNLLDAGALQGGAHPLCLGLTEQIPYLARQQRLQELHLRQPQRRRQHLLELGEVGARAVDVDRAQVEARIKVSEADIDDFVREQPNTSDLSQLGLNLSHILVRVPESATPEQVKGLEARAQRAADRARQGEDFAALAREYSDAPEAASGGAFGMRAADRLPEIFVNATRSLNAGEIAGPVRSPAAFTAAATTTASASATA